MAWRTPAMVALALLALLGSLSVVIDLFRGHRPPQASFTRVGVTVEVPVRGEVPPGAVLSVELPDVPADVSRPLSAWEKGEGGRYRLSFGLEVKATPSQVRARLQAPGWVPAESEVAVLQGEPDALVGEVAGVELVRRVK